MCFSSHFLELAFSLEWALTLDESKAIYILIQDTMRSEKKTKKNLVKCWPMKLSVWNEWFCNLSHMLLARKFIILTMSRLFCFARSHKHTQTNYSNVCIYYIHARIIRSYKSFPCHSLSSQKPSIDSKRCLFHFAIHHFHLFHLCYNHQSKYVLMF